MAFTVSDNIFMRFFMKKVKEKSDVSEKVNENASDIEIEIVDVVDEKKRKLTWFLVFRAVAMLAALCCFTYATYELTLIYIEAQENKASNNAAIDVLTVNVEDDGKEYYNAKGEKIQFENSGTGVAFVWNLEKIKMYNPDAKGYIKQGEGKYIDNPVVQYSDNDYYLHHRSDNSPSGCGAIFIDYRIPEGLNAKNCILYAHNVKAWANFIMFGSLNFYYGDPEYGKENPTMDIYVDDHHYVYYVYSCFRTSAVNSPVYTYEFEDDDEFMEYVESCKSQSSYEFPDAPEVTPESNILTLSTCTLDHEVRMIVQLVRGEEIFDVPVETKEE